MPITKQTAKETVYEVKYICDKCEDGEMKSKNLEVIFPMLPPIYLYPHICDQCGYEMGLARTYPYIDREYDIIK